MLGGANARAFATDATATGAYSLANGVDATANVCVASNATGIQSSAMNTASNSLTGGAGNDTFNGGTGNDSMNGGDGDDIYFVDNIGDKVSDSSGNRYR